jgi:hypothetical protein
VNEDSVLYESMEVVNHEQHDYQNHTPTLVLTKQDVIVDRLKKWWENKYGMVEGQRNNNIYILASALNDFGIDKSFASYVMGEYVTDGFSFNEMNTTISSAYANLSNFNTRFFEDTDAIDQVKTKLKTGVPKKEIRSLLKDQGYEGDTIDQVIRKEEENSESSDFWVKSEKGKVTIIPYKFKQFLETHGFYKYTPDGSNNYIFIVIKSNIIDNTTDDLIKDYILNYLESLEDLSIYNHFAERTKYFKDDFLSLLSYKDTSYLYYLTRIYSLWRMMRLYLTCTLKM